ncbi:hypothetical protein [Rhizobium sp. RCAM05973]|uniref:hypothetical protein n=1 Tax=Rhizobium sp. RCAM05973 TaxID=2994066 RepID=UPI0022EBA744|nr:hypothetical protein [Rhizobium sp. RCAM05973]
MSTVTLVRPTEGFSTGITVAPADDVLDGTLIGDDALMGEFVDTESLMGGWSTKSPTAVTSIFFDFLPPTRFQMLPRKRPANTEDPEFVRLMSRINEIANRKPDWDGDDGRAPTAQALKEACDFLRFLLLQGALPKSVYSPGDGEINFEWTATHRITEVGFSGDGAISWFHRDSSGEKFGDEPFDADSIERNAELLQVLGVSIHPPWSALEMPVFAGLRQR